MSSTTYLAVVIIKSYQYDRIPFI